MDFQTGDRNKTILIFDEATKRDAYMKGLQLKNTGLDAEAIYARLEKQGIHEMLARKVANDVCMQREIDDYNNAPPPSLFAGRIKYFFKWLRD